MRQTVIAEYMSLNEVSTALAIDHGRLLRLGLHLRIASADKRIPESVVTRARAEASEEGRFRLIREWLLDDLRSRTAR